MTRVILSIVLLSSLLIPPLYSLWSQEQPPSIGNNRVLLAANLFNSENVFASFRNGLIRVINAFGRENIYISVYENGSTDRTPILLGELAQLFRQKKIEHHIVTERLAIVRNRAIAPLFFSNHSFTGDRQFSHVLFLNDIVFTETDVLYLLNTNGGDFDFACAMDFYRGFYDRFVARDALGDIPSRWYPYMPDPESIALIARNEPFAVSACWNGAIFLNAEPFRRGVRFRSADEGECYASECLLVCQDFRRLGYGRGFMNPRVRIVYEKQYDRYARYVLPQFAPIIAFFNRLSYLKKPEVPCPSLPMLCC